MRDFINNQVQWQKTSRSGEKYRVVAKMREERNDPIKEEKIGENIEHRHDISR